ncbi:MAG: hypothetical protein UY92_C0001G0015 [Candidatus Magasanikbacteria bacterium GW2011_GWA2_56_11]|uniref:Uncharacterized protein n=1 Tax=Candidatus Magasanikbacteria bacterium GW2011_GWA2_56_11 TaxID=1619044 RepID=A0A0G1YID3_9BACT|nr:MAG: hypothetical protein UY92_C0001G0015 [Candidatus Magasanikbacteria bacterium GW2011_GWA2_56_11]
MNTSLTTACGTGINLNAQTLQHLEAHPDAAALLEEAIGKITIGEREFVLEEVDMGRIVARSSLVDAPAIASDQPTAFACRKGRDIASRVLVGAVKPDTNLFTVIAGKQDDGSWLLYSGFPGPLAPREPHDPNLKGNATELAFWCEHALVWEDGWEQPFESTWIEVIAAAAAKRAAA